MTKLCPRGKAAAKRKFKVYPSAYANAYASKICAGKIKDPSGVKRKDFKGPKPAGKAKGGRIGFRGGAGREGVKPENFPKGKPKSPEEKFTLKQSREKAITSEKRINRAGGGVAEAARKLRAQGLMGGGMAMPRAMYGKGGGVCKRGMGRAYGKNS